MANSFISSPTSAGLQTLITSEAVAGRYVLFGSLSINVDRDEGPIWTISTSSAAPVTTTTLTVFSTAASLAAAAAALTTASCQTLTTDLPILGTVFVLCSSTTNNGVGTVRQVVRSVGSALPLATTVAVNLVAGLDLTPGTWLISAYFQFVLAAATPTNLIVGISAASGTLPSAGEEQGRAGPVPAVTTTNLSVVAPEALTSNLTVVTTVYPVARADFSAGTVAGAVLMTALRIA